MLRLGLTGGIGAGKSTVTTVLAASGAYIVDADQVAREIVGPDSSGLAMLVAEFGDTILQASGELDRAALARIAFADPGRTAALNAITHPLIAERTAELIAAAPADAIVVHDMPLLVESGLAATYHLVIVVDTAAEVRLRRLVEHRGFTEEDAKARMQRQASDTERREVADIILDNSGPIELVQSTVEDIYRNRLRLFDHNLRTAQAVYPSGELVDYRPEWVGQARRECARLAAILGEIPLSIEHSGPTAVPGSPACDLIEIAVVVPGLATGPLAVKAAKLLADSGYVPSAGESGLDSTVVFRWCDPARPLLIVISGAEDPYQSEINLASHAGEVTITMQPRPIAEALAASGARELSASPRQA